MAKKIKSIQAKRGLPMGAKVAIAVGAMGAATLFGACENETNSDPKVCGCPNGTFHDEGTNMPCCDGENCACKVAYNVSLGTKQIRVEDTTGLASKADIQSSLSNLWANSPTDPSILHFKDMATSPIMVIENTHNFRVIGSKFFIGIDAFSTDANTTISAAIWDIYYGDGEETPGTPLMSKAFGKEVKRSARVPGTVFGS
jgi:hypothetical protein